MIWAYVLENQGVQDLRSNQPVFLLINELGISDDYIVFDDDTTRPELNGLLSELNAGDRLIVRSVEDMADTMTELQTVFQLLTDKRVTLCSCVEDFLCGEDYLSALTGCMALLTAFRRKKQKLAYDKAHSAGKVGRPEKTIAIEQAVAMRQTGLFSISQISAVTGVSKSTLYRHIEK